MRYVIIGLGNIGSQYEFSRHNIGFEVVDALASMNNLSFIPGKGDFYQSAPDSSRKPRILSWFKQFFRAENPDLTDSKASCPDIPFAGVLIKPTTLMNRSGIAARQALELFSVEPQRLIVVVDDFHLPLGKLRLRKSGSDGGHNGLKSIISELGTNDFPRLRVGIGPKPPQRDIIEFVLGQFAESEQVIKKSAISRAADACYTIISNTSKNSLDIAAEKYNTAADPAPGSD